MKKINNDLQNDTLEAFYLVYGIEPYLIKEIKNRFILKFNDSFDLNTFIYNEDNFELKDALDKIQTNPFFSDKKLIVFNNVSLFKNDVDESFINCLFISKNVNTVLFVENDASKVKKTNLYNFINENGYILNLSKQTNEVLEKFILKQLKYKNKQITKKDLDYFITLVGNDLYTITNEIDKLLSYIGDREFINKDDIDIITTVSIDNNIWDLVNAINSSNKKQVLDIYSKLLSLNETSESIFNSVKYNYRQLINIKDLVNRKMTVNEITNLENLNRLPRFVVNKIINLAVNTDMNYLYQKIDDLAKLTKLSKTGDMNKDISVLLSIIK